MSKNQKRGIGEYQIKKMAVAVNSILESLSDGKWHQYSELKQKNGISSATLSKHLKTLKTILEKKVDIESGKYPYPVLYRVSELTAVALRQVKIANFIDGKMEKVLLETKNPILVLEFLNTFMNILTLGLLKMIKEAEEETGHIDEELLSLVFQLRIMPFMRFYWTFLTITKGTWNPHDLNQTIKQQLEKMQQLRKQVEKKE